MREKLIELINAGTITCHERDCSSCEYDDIDCQEQLIAELLIENGVEIPVRCGECVHLNKHGVCEFHYDLVRFHDDYCSDGELKECEE